MFPLAVSSLPANAEALRNALEESLSRLLQPAGPMVTVEDRNFPDLAAIRVSLDQATVGDRPPMPGTPVGAVSPAFRVEHFELSGAPIQFQGTTLNLRCEARNVALSQGRDREGNLLLLLQTAEQGSIEIATAISDLENLVRVGAKAPAAEQGVTVEDVRIDLRSRGDRALDALVQIRAKKLFLSATVRISGSVEIDEQLQARLSALQCTGEGTLGSFACNFLTPHLQRFDGREFSLLALPLGEVALRDVRVVAGTDLRLTAQFGQRLA